MIGKGDETNYNLANPLACRESIYMCRVLEVGSSQNPVQDLVVPIIIKFMKIYPFALVKVLVNSFDSHLEDNLFPFYNN